MQSYTVGWLYSRRTHTVKDPANVKESSATPSCATDDQCSAGEFKDTVHLNIPYDMKYK